MLLDLMEVVSLHQVHSSQVVRVNRILHSRQCDADRPLVFNYILVGNPTAKFLLELSLRVAVENTQSTRIISSRKLLWPYSFNVKHSDSQSLIALHGSVGI